MGFKKSVQIHRTFGEEMQKASWSPGQTSEILYIVGETHNYSIIIDQNYSLYNITNMY